MKLREEKFKLDGRDNFAYEFTFFDRKVCSVKRENLCNIYSGVH